MAATHLTPSSTFFPAQLVEALAKSIPAYKQETPKIQAGIAGMLWNCKGDHREHKKHNGYFSFHYKELAELFDGKFNAVNEKLKFVEDHSEWHYTNGSGDGYTKGYQPSQAYSKVLDEVLSQKPQTKLPLLYADGRTFKTLLGAVASKDMHGVTIDKWKFANDSVLLNQVPVNVASLEALLTTTESLIVGWRDAVRYTVDHNLKDPNYLFLESLREQLQKILLVSHATTGGTGCVPHRYQESKSGRLYAQGAINLQNAPKILRHAALEGFYDFDIANCHFSILLQMAANGNVECPAITHYIENKDSVRCQLAREIGITETETKKCLLALMYGAQLTTFHENAIPLLIQEKAEDLYAHPLFIDLARDIKLANSCALNFPKQKLKESRRNCFEKTMNTFDVAENRQIAHMTQGVEAMALNACLKGNLDSIVLLQHDGFTAMRELKTQSMEDAIFAATGFKLTLEVKKVAPDIESFQKRSIPTHTSR